MADKSGTERGMKEQILDSLEGGFVVTKVEEDFEEDTAIVCEFVKNGEEGIFRYYWSEGGVGIDYVRDYDNLYEDIDCIEDDIHEWVDKHFKFKSTISLKHDGKELIK